MKLRKSLGIMLAFSVMCAAGGAEASIQLVGGFEGVTCYPDDPENNMTPLGDHDWVKLVYIDEPGASPDTINFKFTRDNDYYPEHWGWSFVYGWGIAELGYSPPSIVAVLPDSGYYYFHFNDSTYAYCLERPQGKIHGDLTSDLTGELPEDATVTLMDSDHQNICGCTEFCGKSFCFDNLPEGTYALYATAPAYNDTMVTGISLSAGDSVRVDINLNSNTAVAISSTQCRRNENEIILTWTTGSDCSGAGFDIYRGEEPRFSESRKINKDPVYYTTGYRYVDTGIDPYSDYYYYIVEAGDISGSMYGPLESKGSTPEVKGKLGQNYPNPFNPSTTIPFLVGDLGGGAMVTVSFFDVAGRMVESHELGIKPSGEYEFAWNPSSSGKNDIPSGVYYCRLTIGKESYTRKMILLR